MRRFFRFLYQECLVIFLCHFRSSFVPFDHQCVVSQTPVLSKVLWFPVHGCQFTIFHIGIHTIRVYLSIVPDAMLWKSWTLGNNTDTQATLVWNIRHQTLTSTPCHCRNHLADAFECFWGWMTPTEMKPRITTICGVIVDLPHYVFFLCFPLLKHAGSRFTKHHRLPIQCPSCPCSTSPSSFSSDSVHHSCKSFLRGEA